MKTKLILSTLLVIAWNATSRGEGDTVNQVVLYQVGQQGKYCLSITPNVSGCVSGTSGQGETVNLMEFVKDKEVVFRNLSDAPHDMKFSGVNAEDLPPQAPQAADAVKKFNAEDLEKNKISCSFHGAQLSVGYKVMGPAGMAAQKGADGDGHKEGADGPKAGAAEGQAGAGGGALGALGGSEGAAGTGGGNLKITGLADVSKEVLAKGGAADVEKLVSARPELLEALKEVRPLLAAEIAPKIIAAGFKGTGLGGGLDGLGGAPAGAGAPGQGGLPAGMMAGGTTMAKMGAGAGGGFNVIREDLTGGENDNEDWVPGSKPKANAGRRVVFANGNAAVVFGGGSGSKDSGKSGAARGIASVGSQGADSIRTQLKPVQSRRQINWLGMLMDGHTWLIISLVVAVGMTARVAVAGTRNARKAKKLS